MMMSRDKIEDKLEELIAASRLNELLNKKEADFDDDDFEEDDFEEDDFEDED